MNGPVRSNNIHTTIRLSNNSFSSLEIVSQPASQPVAGQSLSAIGCDRILIPARASLRALRPPLLCVMGSLLLVLEKERS